MSEKRLIKQLQKKIDLLERENSRLTRDLYGDCRKVVLTDEQYLSALLATKTFRWTRLPRQLWGRLRASYFALRGQGSQPSGQPSP